MSSLYTKPFQYVDWRVIVLLFVVAPVPLRGQPSLIDSIQQELSLSPNDAVRMDLLLGLCRATIFTYGGEQTKPVVARAKQHALIKADSSGLGRVLLFQYMTDYTVEKGIPEEVEAAFRIGKSIDDRSLEIFAVYHLVEHYLYDKNDLVNTEKWLSYGHQRLLPTINPKHRGNLYKVTALYHQSKGNKDSTDYWLSAAQQAFQRVGDYIAPRLGRVPAGNWDGGALNLNQILNYQGQNAIARGDFQLAQDKYSTALAIARKWRINQALARTLSGLGELQATLGDISGAIASFSAALETHKRQQEKLHASNAAQRIGQLFLLVNDGKAAEKYYARARDDAAAIMDTIEMTNSLLGLTWSTQMQGKRSLAKQYLAQAEELAVRSKDSISQSYLRSERARQTFIDKRYVEAIGAYEAAISLHQHYQHETSIQTDLMGLVRCYLELNQLDSALAIMPRAEEMVLRVGSIHKQRETAELYAKIAELAGNLPLTVAQHKRIQAINDSINQQDAQLSLRREEVRQNVEDIRQENETLTREGQLLAQRSRLYLALAVALLLLLSIGGYLLLRLRKTQRKLSSSNAELKALNATKDRFFGIIAHDLRSPIIALDGVGEQLAFLLGKGRTEKANALASNIGHTAGHLSRLLDQLLAWALLQQGTMPHHPEVIPVAEIVEEVMELFGATATNKGVLLDYQVASELQLRADPTGMRTMLRNLVSNAIKFTPKGGCVLINGLRSKGGEIVLEIRDDGIGMAPQQLENILAGERRTERGTAGERGSGLGLRLVRELAELHNADLSVESTPGAGSRFRLTFPV